MTANIRTPQRTVSAMQRFAVSQKNRTEAITISPFSLALPYRTENRRFSTLSCTKTGSTQPKLSAACFVVQSCLADADFVVFSDYCLIGTRQRRFFFCVGGSVIQVTVLVADGDDERLQLGRQLVLPAQIVVLGLAEGADAHLIAAQEQYAGVVRVRHILHRLE